MVAYHFPPLTGSSGIQRALRFSSHLPDFGWEPIVLTCHVRAYEHCSEDLVGQIRADVPVIRAQAWDTRRHLSIRARYPAMLGRPDRWWSWWLGAVPAGLRAISRYRPDAIWSTYPIATAHAIGVTLSRMSGIPLIADFRDPMAQEGYPTDKKTWRSFERIEKRTIRRARFSTFTSPSAVEQYKSKYPKAASRFSLLENGYDEEAFSGILGQEPPLHDQRLTLLHSGAVYPSERNPTQLFVALSQLRMERPEIFAKLILRFRAPVHEALLNELAERHNVKEAIEVLPPLGYREAASEMRRADGLFILQAANCNAQIPAKLYEYFRAQRPVLILADPRGDTATVAHRAGIRSIAPLEDGQGIRTLLESIVEDPSAAHAYPDPDAVAAASRHSRTGDLATLLDRAAAGSLSVVPPPHP